MDNLKDYFLAEDNSENFHFSGDDVNATGDENWNVEGNAPEAQPSQSFRISLANNGSTAITDVVFLDAFLNVGTTTPWGVTTGITPTYDLPGQTYIQFLNWLTSNTAKIRQITTVCSNSTTLRASYKVESYNMQGDSFSKLIRPVFNTFQNITDQIDTPVDFYLTGATKITVSSIAAGATISFEFYPSKVTRTIKGIADGRSYSDPKTSGMQVIGQKPPTSLI